MGIERAWSIGWAFLRNGQDCLSRRCLIYVGNVGPAAGNPADDRSIGPCRDPLSVLSHRAYSAAGSDGAIGC
jgi:hypothetical protein